MIPKELHLRNILDTTIEELARLPSATAEEWAVIDRAAAYKKKDRWDYLRSMLTPDFPGIGAKGAVLQRRWLKKGKEFVISMLWVLICGRAEHHVALAEWEARKIAEATERQNQRAQEIKDKVLRRDVQMARVMALQALPCGYRPAESIRAGDYLGYVLGRLLAFRGQILQNGLIDWQLIDLAAEKRGQTWLEFMAVEIVREAVWRSMIGGASNSRLWRAKRVKVWQRDGEASGLAALFVAVSFQAGLLLQGQSGYPLFVGGPSGMEKRKRLEPIFSAFVNGEPLPSVPAWLMG